MARESVLDAQWEERFTHQERLEKGTFSVAPAIPVERPQVETFAFDDTGGLNVHEVAHPAHPAQVLDARGEPIGVIFEASAAREASIPDNNRKEKAPGIIKKTKRFLLDWVRSIYKNFEEKQDKKIEEKLQNPEKNEREIKMELQYAFFNVVGRNAISRGLINLKYAIQIPGLIFDHLPIPIAFLGKIPVLLSGVVVTVFFNIPNAIQAFSEKRYKKGLYELLILSPLSALIPIGHPFVNSFWQELFIFKPLEYRKNIKIIKHLEKILNGETQAEEAVRKTYKKYFEDLIEKKYRNKGILHLFKKRTTKEMYLKMKQDIDKQIRKAEPKLRSIEKKIHDAEQRIEDLRKSDGSKKPTLKQRLIKWGKLSYNHAIAVGNKIQKEFIEYKLEVAQILQRVIDTEVSNNHKDGSAGN